MLEMFPSSGCFITFKSNQNSKSTPGRSKFVVQFSTQGFEPLAALTAKEPSTFHLAWVETERPTKNHGCRRLFILCQLIWL